MKAKSTLAAIAAAGAFAAGSAEATDYRFTVKSPQRGNKVVLWRTGTLDPGQGALRTLTAGNNQGASVTDYNPVTDANLPVETHEGTEGIGAGLSAIGKFFGL